MRRFLVGLSVAALLPACAATEPVERNAAPTTSSRVTPSESGRAVPPPSEAAEADPAPPEPAWVVGASPLPLRPDGFGQVLPTPEVLRNRQLPTVDRLPPPASGGFESTVQPITPDVRERMGETWSPDCPVGLDDLRYVTVSFRGFDGKAHTGELVVAASVADQVVRVFSELFAADFPIEEMRLVTTADLDAAPTGDGNNTAAFVCRARRGQRTWSQHAYGTAVDVNPFQNPYVKRDLVLPELASAYTDRDHLRPGMHVHGAPSVGAFDGIGWGWGGRWRSSKDYMHFSLTGE